MTIHFHTKHYLESGLPLHEYMLMMLYEQKTTWTREELMAILSVTDRTVTRIRMNLASQGYLRIINKWHFEITDKLYPKTTKKKANETVNKLMAQPGVQNDVQQRPVA